MRSFGLPRDMYLTRTRDGEGWRYSIADLPGGQPVYGLTRPGYAVQLSGGMAAVVRYEDGVERDLSAAVREGIVGIRVGYSAEVLRVHFKGGMHSMVASRMLFQLVRRGEDPSAWKVDSDYDRIRLLDHRREVRAERKDPYWWRVYDPDIADEFSRALADAAGLEDRFVLWLSS